MGKSVREGGGECVLGNDERGVGKCGRGGGDHGTTAAEAP